MQTGRGVQGQKRVTLEYVVLSIHRRRGGAGRVERVAVDIEGKGQRRPTQVTIIQAGPC